VLQTLDDAGGSHATRSAHCYEPTLQVAAFKFVEHGSDQDSAGGADGMAHGNGPAIGIDARAIEAQVTDELLYYDGECFVDLRQIDFVRGDSGFGQHLSGCRHRSIQHQDRVIAHVGGRNHEGAGLHAIIHLWLGSPDRSH
jgi:hypothetical protein